MGKRIIQQRRGKGSPTYRARKYPQIKFEYPAEEGEAEVLKLINFGNYSTPIAKIKLGKKIFFNIATEGLGEGEKIMVGKGAEIKPGNIAPLSVLPLGTNICNIEIAPLGGGKLVRAGGIAAQVVGKTRAGVVILLPSKKEKIFDERARATVGVVAGGGRVEKPFIKAGKKVFAMRAKGKLYPRTSPIKMNAVDHPFGGGRGKNIGKPSIAPRWAPPGRKVGLLRARKTGRGGKR